MMVIGDEVPWSAVLRTGCGLEVVVRHHMPSHRRRASRTSGRPGDLSLMAALETRERAAHQLMHVYPGMGCQAADRLAALLRG